MAKIDVQREATPQLTADVRMYEISDGGRVSPAPPGWGCLLLASKLPPLSGWDALPLLRDQPLKPGEHRRLGFVFLSPQEAVAALEQAGHFYIYDGRVIGEATIVPNGS